MAPRPFRILVPNDPRLFVGVFAWLDSSLFNGAGYHLCRAAEVGGLAMADYPYSSAQLMLDTVGMNFFPDFRLEAVDRDFSGVSVARLWRRGRVMSLEELAGRDLYLVMFTSAAPQSDGQCDRVIVHFEPLE
jgi:hypothetical protein